LLTHTCQALQYCRLIKKIMTQLLVATGYHWYLLAIALTQPGTGIDINLFDIECVCLLQHVQLLQQVFTEVTPMT
jgi:hypothetical protein